MTHIDGTWDFKKLIKIDGSDGAISYLRFCAEFYGASLSFAEEIRKKAELCEKFSGFKK